MINILFSVLAIISTAVCYALRHEGIWLLLCGVNIMCLVNLIVEKVGK